MREIKVKIDESLSSAVQARQMELDSIKICDVLEYDNDGTKELSVHIIFNEEYQKMVEENEDLSKAQLCDI